MMRPRVLLIPFLLLAAGCGEKAEPGVQAVEKVAVALDFTPNAVHAPIYSAVRTGADRAEGVELVIRKPGSGPDALKLVASGKVDLGILDIHDLAIAQEKGVDVVGIGALVSKPLAALVARGGVKRPAELEGRRVGVSGLPSDPAFLRAIFRHDKADYDRVREVTIGFTAVPALIARRVDAVPVFWNAEGVELKRRGFAFTEFRIEDFGAPPYPEVVLFTSREALRDRRDTLRRALRAIAAGAAASFEEPGPTAKQIAEAAGTSDSGLVSAQLDAVREVVSPDLRLDRAVLQEWAEFDEEIGIVERRPDVDRAFDFSLAP